MDKIRALVWYLDTKNETVTFLILEYELSRLELYGCNYGALVYHHEYSADENSNACYM
jgi:hypothetical protein